ncbi:hypothetical protein J36TS2_39780 [Bacillus paralicheniformis]|nr:hypothetical protein J36TS2_39780 [Bacillus paralicheniformis]
MKEFFIGFIKGFTPLKESFIPPMKEFFIGGTLWISVDMLIMWISVDNFSDIKKEPNGSYKV